MQPTFFRFETLDARQLHSSNMVSVKTLAIVRTSIMCLALTNTVYAWTRYDTTFLRYVYLTVWSFDVLTLYFGLGAYCCWQVVLGRENWTGSNSHKWPAYRKAAQIAYTIGLPASTVVTLLYWSLVFPDEDVSGVGYLTTSVVHALNSCFFLLDFAINRNLIAHRHGLFVGSYATVYLLFNFIYCQALDTVIYKALDWDKVSGYVFAVVGILATVGSFYLYLWLSPKRDRWQGVVPFDDSESVPPRVQELAGVRAESREDETQRLSSRELGGSEFDQVKAGVAEEEAKADEHV